MAIASIKDSTMMYFSCDVGKFFDRNRGVLDVNYYDYSSLMGTTFGMDKKQRIQTFASGSSHAMTLMAVDLDANGQPKKWMVKIVGDPGANNGHLIMTVNGSTNTCSAWLSTRNTSPTKSGKY